MGKKRDKNLTLEVLSYFSLPKPQWTGPEFVTSRKFIESFTRFQNTGGLCFYIYVDI